MTDKKPVYNGYDEKYLSGEELKELFKNKYYCSGRHHATIMGISIPDYLDLLKISNTTQYRIFINQYFCRVMNSTTDGLICFFSYSELNSANSSSNTTGTPIKKVCPQCGKPMAFRTGKFGEFLGCTGYPACRYTCHIPIIGNI